MTAKHTRGPWDYVGYQVEAADGTLICGLSGWKNPGATRANARLIAAAPDLLDALIEAVAVIEKIKPAEFGHGTIVRGKDAIAKATGEQV